MYTLSTPHSGRAAAPVGLRADTATEGPAEKLGRLLDNLPQGRVPLGAIVDALGSAGTGLCLLLFGLTALVPGIAPVFGVALCAISLGLVVGREEPYLPEFMRRWSMDSERLRAGLRRLIPRVARVETWLHPRATHLLHGAGLRLIGFASLINGILIVLPIPFGNTVPAIAMLVLALGLVTADGIAASLGIAATLIAIAIDTAFVGISFAAAASVVKSLF
jgi:hypothetical protein